MARIELRNATIRLLDGLSGVALVNEATPMPNDTNIGVDNIDINTAVAELIPVGARFTIDGEDDVVIHTVTARTPLSTAPTTAIDFTPGLNADVLNNAVITFLPQRIEIKIGDGNVVWTINREFEYLLDRGNLDTVREGDQQPLDVTIDSVYEHIITGTGEDITPYDALNGTGGADEWVSSSDDPCEPYSVDVEIEHDPPCSGSDARDTAEVTLLPDFRYDTFEADLDAATFSITGRCNITKPTVTRPIPVEDFILTGESTLSVDQSIILVGPMILSQTLTLTQVADVELVPA